MYKIGNRKIRDSISGNVKVLAEKTYNLKSSVQGIVSYVAMQPLGKSVPVDKNQTILKFEITDLNRSLNQALMAKSHFLERIEKGSALALQLEIENEDLQSLIPLKDKISLIELNRKKNLVESLSTQLEHEKFPSMKDFWIIKLILKTFVLKLVKCPLKVQLTDYSSHQMQILETLFFPVTTLELLFQGSDNRSID